MRPVVLPELSIVISNHNTRELLEPCVRSVFNEMERAGLHAELIVVDDASTDGSAEMVAATFPKVTLIRCQEREGYARANNIGIACSAGWAVLLLNSDTVVLPEALSEMLAALRRRDDVAAVGPMLLNPNGTLQRSCWPFPLRALVGNTLPLFRTGLWDDYRSWDHRVDREVDCISSAALMVRRLALDRVGLLDEQFWVYGVDIDWAMRARGKGYRCLSLSGARVIHHGGASWRSLPQMTADHLNGQLRLFRKHYGPAGVAVFRAVVFVNSLARFLIWGAAWVLGRQDLRPKVDYFKHMARWCLTGMASRLPGSGSIPPA